MNALENQLLFLFGDGSVSIILFGDDAGLCPSGLFPDGGLAAFQETEKTEYNRNVHKDEIVRDLKNFAVSMVHEWWEAGKNSHSIKK